MDNAAMVDLIAAALHEAPRLDGAACAGLHPLFDPINPHADPDDEDFRVHAAIRICHTSCPCIDACKSVYGDSGPVYGVTAGRYVPAPQQFPTYRAPGRQRAPREPRLPKESA